MLIENNRVREEHQQAERLQHGHKLLLAGPDFLVSFAFLDKVDKELRRKSGLDEDVLLSLLKEYASIYELLAGLVGKENIIVAKTEFTFGKNSPTGVQLQSVNLPNELSFGAVEIPPLSKFYRAWPRDAYTLVDAKVLISKDAWSTQGKNMEYSGLAEGGRVLARGKAILVTPDIWKTSKDEIRSLQERGFKVGRLPFVDPVKQKYDFKENHIEGENGQLYLVVADSYSRQGGHTRSSISQACDSVEVEIVEVDDKNLPPLAFNLVQFDDRSIAMTTSEARDLDVTLSWLVGKGKIFTTEIPLVQIPNLTCGGIRCLSNIIPRCMGY
jgi:hypothetical protein